MLCPSGTCSKSSYSSTFFSIVEKTSGLNSVDSVTLERVEPMMTIRNGSILVNTNWESKVQEILFVRNLKVNFSRSLGAFRKGSDLQRVET